MRTNNNQFCEIDAKYHAILLVQYATMSLIPTKCGPENPAKSVSWRVSSFHPNAGGLPRSKVLRNSRANAL